MTKDTQTDTTRTRARSLTPVAKISTSEYENLGPLGALCGTWKNVIGTDKDLEGRGWNMIALPFAGNSGLNYRLLLNQYNETLEFKFVDDDIPNRGIDIHRPANTDPDQFVAALDYEQTICQTASADSPVSGIPFDPAHPVIHHEPGLWLHMKNEQTDGIDIARLAAIPHGNSVLALGRSQQQAGESLNKPQIPKWSGLPIGVTSDITDTVIEEGAEEAILGHPYLAPYKHFNKKPFKGLFNPVRPTELLEQALGDVQNISKITTLEVDTQLGTGGIDNIPFIVKQANATLMWSIFWVFEFEEKNCKQTWMQYAQLVMLDFFERRDGKDGLIKWPHVSINTMKKV